MKNKLYRKSLVFGAAVLLISITMTPVLSLSVFNTTINNLDRANMKNMEHLHYRKTIIVPDDYPTIQEAINNANDGDRIEVREGIYYENIVVNKIVEIIGAGFRRTIIDGGGIDHTVQIIIDGVEISFFTIRNSGAENIGLLIKSLFNTIKMNNITGNGYGIKLESSTHNTIMDNWIVYNQNRGIWLYASSTNDFSGNVICCNGDDGILVDISSTSNTITGNIVSDNGAKNSGHGMFIKGASRSNTFVGNKLALNTFGLGGIEASDSNILHHNDFHDNGQNAYDSSVNIWNSVDKGNHWSDFDDPAEGAYDNDSNGIADDTYNIPEGENEDTYPLMYPPIPCTPKIEGPTTVESGEEVTYHIWTPTTDDCPRYEKVFYQVYWDNGDYWETTETTVDTTTGTDISHTWHLPKGVEQRTYNVIVRALVEIEGFRVNSEGSRGLTVKVPRYKDKILIQNDKNLLEKILPFGGKETLNVPRNCDIIVPIDYETIQDAIDHALEGSTICVWEGIYKENINIEEKKNLILSGNGSQNTIIEGQGLDSSVVTIKDTSDIVFTGFKVTNGDLAGVWMHNTTGCMVNDNSFGDEISDSVVVYYSQDATITNNNFKECGLGIYGNTLEHFLHTVENNMVNDIELFYAKNKNDLYISGDVHNYGSIILVNCSTVLIRNLDNLHNTHVGIELAYCNDVSVENSDDVSFNYYGMYVYNCSNNVIIKDNEINENILYGIYLRKSSAKIYDNEVHKNIYGVELWESFDNHIEKNNVHHNSQVGIFLQFSHNNEIGRDNWIHENVNGVDIISSSNNYIHNNTIEKNSYNGIYLKNASNNTLLWNQIEHNALEGSEVNVRNGIELTTYSCNNKIEYNSISYQKFWGIMIHENSNGNMIYHNIFYFNGFFWDFLDRHAYDNCDNTWDNGYPEPYENFQYKHGITRECGNCWSHFLCIDQMHGPNQDEVGHDNISDSQYNIPGGNNVERYPLVQFFAKDEIPPEVHPIFPLPGHLHVIPFMDWDWFLKTTVVICFFQELNFKVTAYEPSDEKWQTNFVKVNFSLTKQNTQESINSGWIQYDPFGSGYEWDLTDRFPFGRYKFEVIARDAADNSNNYKIDNLYIFKYP